MSYDRLLEAQRQRREGAALDYGPDHSRLLVRVMRALALGRPVSKEQIDQIVDDLGLGRDEADQFLRRGTERDESDNVTGILGLSLNRTPHQLVVDGTRLWAWCAVATLVLPALLQQTATIESSAPASGERIRLTVTPDRVEDVTPPDAAVSMVVVDPDKPDPSSVEERWAATCHHIHFFPSREEAEQWAAGRDDIAILTVEEGFEFERLVMSKILASL
ncbi:MAG: organomercurial lyase [Dehalococcoidia bacterium]